jgi:hypothetical protein
MCRTSMSLATSASDSSMRWHCHHAKHQQLVDRCRELFALHVIGVAAKGGVLPRTVRRVGARFPQPAKILEMAVLNAFGLKARLERVSAEMRMAPRLRNRADIGQAIDFLRSEK